MDIVKYEYKQPKSVKSELIGFDVLSAFYEVVETPNKLQSLSDEELINLRIDASDAYIFYENLQQTTKKFCNSVYGGVGTPSLRYYRLEVAKDITTEGRGSCILMEKCGQHYFTKMWLGDHKFHEELKENFPRFMINKPKPITQDVVITCDTDSNYVTFDLVFESLGLDPYELPTKESVDFIVYFMRNRLDPLYKTVLDTHIKKRNGDSTMIFELETVGGFGIFLEKKKYVFAKLYHDGKYVGDKLDLKITGIELKQRSSSKMIKNIMETFIDTLFIKKGRIDNKLFFGMCMNVRDRCKAEYVNDLSKSTKLNKYTEYMLDDVNDIKFRKRCPVGVKGAIRYNYLINKYNLRDKYPLLKNGMFIKWYYDVDGLPFTYSSEYGYPKEIAPKMSVNIQLNKVLFASISRLVDGIFTKSDLKSMGDNKINVGFKSLISKFAKK